jgi:hypothetical protein
LYSQVCTCKLFVSSSYNFFYFILGKYYVVDAGYPNRPGYLAPFKGARYHIPDRKKGPAPSGEHEHFNHLHSSIRKMIVAATMCLHNFIRENNAQDKHFTKCDRDPDYVPTIPERYKKSRLIQNAGDTSTPESSDLSMDRFRDDLARAITRSS